MFGLISWGAMLGNMVPYKANALLVKKMKGKGAGKSMEAMSVFEMAGKKSSKEELGQKLGEAS